MTRLHQLIERTKDSPALGIAAYSYDPVFVDIAALLGFQVLWIEMEHTFISFAQAADLCRMASGAGILTMIRIPDARRESVLKACECGPDILDLPMANSAEDLEQLVEYARFPPVGRRGYFSVSRAVGYGLAGDVPRIQQELNEQLCLMAQVETIEAVERTAELLRVPGIDAIFLGPGDLSASLGVPGQTSHPRVQRAAGAVIGQAKANGKLVAAAGSAADYEFWVSAGVDLLFCSNDVACLKLGAQQVLREVKAACERHARAAV